jgi:hypothetical protein
MSGTFVPQAAAGNNEARWFDGFSPGSPKCVILSKVLAPNTEKYVVIDPLFYWPKSM